MEEIKNEKKEIKKKERIINKEKKREKKLEIKNSFKNSEVVFLVLLTCLVSLVMGWTICYKINLKTKNIINDQDLEQFIKTYNNIKENYYDKLDTNKIISGAIKGMLKEVGDEYSTIISEDEQTSFDSRLQGSYKGIGIEVTNNQEGDIVIVGVFKNSSAYEQDIQEGDIIVSISGMDLRGKQTSTLTDYISKNEQEYKMVILRDGKELEKTLVKKNIVIESVSSKIYTKNNKKIGYIKIDLFSMVAAGQFKNHLTQLENEKIDSLIIDVRNNDGGYLTTATSIISSFLDKKHVIYQIQKKDEITKFYSEGKETKKYPIVILQNEGSASASELLSVTLKEEYGATVIGKNSYGKGTVQELVKLSNGIEYKFTSKKWLSPKGKWIHNVGVIPDVVVDMKEEYYKSPTEENDNQLQKAVTLLSE